MAAKQIQMSELVEWIAEKRAEAEKTLKAREQMAAVWRNGTDKSWLAAGCKMSKVARLKEAEKHTRIAAKNRRDVLMWRILEGRLMVGGGIRGLNSGSWKIYVPTQIPEKATE